MHNFMGNLSASVGTFAFLALRIIDDPEFKYVKLPKTVELLQPYTQFIFNIIVIIILFGLSVLTTWGSDHKWDSTHVSVSWQISLLFYLSIHEVLSIYEIMKIWRYKKLGTTFLGILAISQGAVFASWKVAFLVAGPPALLHAYTLIFFVYLGITKRGNEAIKKTCTKMCLMMGCAIIVSFAGLVVSILNKGNSWDALVQCMSSAFVNLMPRLWAPIKPEGEKQETGSDGTQRADNKVEGTSEDEKRLVPYSQAV